MEFLELAKARYSCRKFTARPVEDEKLAKILEAAKSLGLDSTWVGLVDRVKLKQSFAEMNGYTIISIIPIGYAAPEPAGQPHKWHNQRKGVDAITTWL